MCLSVLMCIEAAATDFSCWMSLGRSCLVFRFGHGKRGGWRAAGGVDGEAVGGVRHGERWWH